MKQFGTTHDTLRVLCLGISFTGLRDSALHPFRLYCPLDWCSLHLVSAVGENDTVLAYRRRSGNRGDEQVQAVSWTGGPGGLR